MIIDLKANKHLTEAEQRQVREAVEKRLQAGEKLADFVKEDYNVAESTLRIELKRYGMTVNTRKCEVEKEKRGGAEVEYDTKFLLELRQDRQHSFRTSQELISWFEEVASEALPNVPTAKLISLAIKELGERLEKELEQGKSK